MKPDVIAPTAYRTVFSLFPVTQHLQVLVECHVETCSSRGFQRKVLLCQWERAASQLWSDHSAEKRSHRKTSEWNDTCISRTVVIVNALQMLAIKTFSMFRVSSAYFLAYVSAAIPPAKEREMVEGVWILTAYVHEMSEC